jgi:DNA-binding PadR family transcriptional regulator
MALRTVRVRRGNVTELVTGLDAWGTGGVPRILSVKVIKPATFKGSHNLLKSLCLFMLAYSILSRKHGGLLTASELSELTDWSLASVKASMPKWHRWGIVKRQRFKHPGRRQGFRYAITPRGLAWLRRHRRHMDPQLQEWNAKSKAVWGYGLSDLCVEQELPVPVPMREYLEQEPDTDFDDGEEES